jgi:hypothetical protein
MVEILAVDTVLIYKANFTLVEDYISAGYALVKFTLGHIFQFHKVMPVQSVGIAVF